MLFYHCRIIASAERYCVSEYTVDDAPGLGVRFIGALVLITELCARNTELMFGRNRGKHWRFGEVEAVVVQVKKEG